MGRVSCPLYAYVLNCARPEFEGRGGGGLYGITMSGITGSVHSGLQCTTKFVRGPLFIERGYTQYTRLRRLSVFQDNV